MKTVIVGCGRVGATIAERFDAAGHEVIVLDIATKAFDRLPTSFRGSAVRGDGTDEDTLRRAGAEDADVFLAMTEGDNRNVMAAQVAVEGLGARRVIAKINDPVRAAAYAELGLATLCRTTLMADAVSSYLGEPVTGEPAIHAPRGTHHGGEHHESDGLVELTRPAADQAGTQGMPAMTGAPGTTAPDGSVGWARTTREG